MTYQLPPDLDRRVQSQIALGIYQTPAEVLNDALGALERQNSDLAAIRRGIEDEKAGRLTPLHEFDRQFRGRLRFQFARMKYDGGAGRRGQARRPGCRRLVRPATNAASRYSPGQIKEIRRRAVIGEPDMKRISPSFAERVNLSVRMGNRRMTRLTNGFSEKVGQPRSDDESLPRRLQLLQGTRYPQNVTGSGRWPDPTMFGQLGN